MGYVRFQGGNIGNLTVDNYNNFLAAGNILIGARYTQNFWDFFVRGILDILYTSNTDQPNGDIISYFLLESGASLFTNISLESFTFSPRLELSIAGVLRHIDYPNLQVAGELSLPFTRGENRLTFSVAGAYSIFRRFHGGETIPVGRTNELVVGMNWSHEENWELSLAYHHIFDDYDANIFIARPLESYAELAVTIAIGHSLLRIGAFFNDHAGSIELAISQGNFPQHDSIGLEDPERPTYYLTPLQQNQGDIDRYSLTDVYDETAFGPPLPGVDDIPEGDPLYISPDRREFLMQQVREIFATTEDGEERARRLIELGQDLPTAEQLFIIGHTTSREHIAYENHHALEDDYTLSLLLSFEAGECRDVRRAVEEYLRAVGFPQSRLRTVESQSHTFLLIQTDSGEWISLDTGRYVRFNTDDIWQAVRYYMPRSGVVSISDGNRTDAAVAPSIQVVDTFLDTMHGGR